jgi:hypothetical protein
MGWQVARKLEDHPRITARVNYGTSSDPAVATDNAIAAVFGTPRIIRANGLKLTSGYGATETIGNIFGKDALLAYVPARPSRRTPAFAYEFWNTPAGAAERMPTERWFDIDRIANIIRVRRKYDLKFITVDGTGKSAGAGYLIKNAVA